MATTTTTISKDQKLNLTVEFTGGLELLFSNKKKHMVSIANRFTPTSTSLSQLESITTAKQGDNQNKIESEPHSDIQTQPSNIKYLVSWLVENLMRDRRKELFILEDGSIRPGILVLINDADWELEGEEEYVLCEGDSVLFVSTLHGG